MLHRAALRARAQRENALAARVQGVLFDYRDAERKIGLYGDTLIPKARQSLRATEAAFRSASASFLDLVDAQRSLLDFELSYERALADRAQRLAELEMLVGRSIPRRYADTESRPGGDEVDYGVGPAGNGES
jgi:outer membrane protein TolC